MTNSLYDNKSRELIYKFYESGIEQLLDEYVNHSNTEISSKANKIQDLLEELTVKFL